MPIEGSTLPIRRVRVGYCGRLLKRGNMSTTTIIDNEFCLLWFHNEKKIVHHQFKKFICGDKFRELLNKGCETLKQKGACKWLSDDRGNGALPKEDDDWAKQVWFPQTVKAGWKFWALVLPSQIVGQMNMKSFVNQFAQGGIKVNVFSDPAKALAWLEAQ
jgi:hypothetical protein